MGDTHTYTHTHSHTHTHILHHTHAHKHAHPSTHHTHTRTHTHTTHTHTHTHTSTSRRNYYLQTELLSSTGVEQLDVGPPYGSLSLSSREAESDFTSNTSEAVDADELLRVHDASGVSESVSPSGGSGVWSWGTPGAADPRWSLCSKFQDVHKEKTCSCAPVASKLIWANFATRGRLQVHPRTDTSCLISNALTLRFRHFCRLQHSVARHSPLPGTRQQRPFCRVMFSTLSVETLQRRSFEIQNGRHCYGDRARVFICRHPCCKRTLMTSLRLQCHTDDVSAVSH